MFLEQILNNLTYVLKDLTCNKHLLLFFHFSFFGLPYAEPPIGARRWKVAEGYNSTWAGIRIASEKDDVPGCPQDPNHMTAPTKISEDCLFLNIHAPKKSSTNLLPVMFWIHGGSWQHGHGNSDLYDGESFAKKDVILITINYRLGSLGFLFDQAETRVFHRRRNKTKNRLRNFRRQQQF